MADMRTIGLRTEDGNGEYGNGRVRKGPELLWQWGLWER